MPLHAEDLWPDLSNPAKAQGGGEKDAAVIVGSENYLMVAKVPGARRNAQDWQAYLTETRNVPLEKVTLLRDNEATLEKMRKYAAKAASQVEPGGTLWFVFIGHGAPSRDGKDGLLVGVDAQQDADGLYARSLARRELLDILNKGKQARTVVLVDACFSGRSSSGEALVAGLQPLVLTRSAMTDIDHRTILLTAAKSDQFAGPLPKAESSRPAFSYLALGALRGWAADANGKVTAAALIAFANKALGLAHDRTQTPELSAGAAGAVLGLGRENSPNLAKIDREGGVDVETKSTIDRESGEGVETKSTNAEETPASEDESTFYAYGFRVGQNLAQIKPSEAEASAISQGLRDSITGKTSSVDMASYLPKVSEMATARQKGAISHNREIENTFYAYGYRIGQNLASTTPTESEAKMISQGLRDAVRGKAASVDMAVYLPKVGAMASKRLAAKAKGIKEQGNSFGQAFALEDGVRQIPMGGWIKTEVEGSGIIPTQEDTVKVHYRGTLIDGSEFDSSYKRGQPASFPLKAVIPCWTNGVSMMKVGEKAKLVCPSDAAYGDQGHPPVIPGGATLIFEIELLDIVRKKRA